MQRPLVSICVPSYNGELFIGEALSSAFSQTYSKIEVIISDSGSTDGTVGIAREVTSNRDAAVRFLPDTTVGMVRNWNALANTARGVYLKFLFQDDVLAPDCVEKMVALAERDARIGLVFCRRHLIVEPSAEGTSVAQWYRRHADLARGLGALRAVREGTQLLASRSLLDEPLNKMR